MSTKNTKTSNKTSSNKEEEYFFSSNSTIQRAIHDSAHFYLKISVNFIKDKRISNDCFRMLTLLLSKTDGWKIVPKVLAKELKEYGIGFNKTYHLITEAIDLGYMKREVVKKGNLPIGNNYFVSEEPIFSNNSSAITDSVITKPVKHINNQVSIHKKDDREKIPLPKTPPKKAAKPTTAPSSPIIPLWFLKEEGSASIPQAEYDEKVKKYGEKIVDQAVSKIRELDSDYKSSKSGNGYKSKNLSKNLDKICEELLLKKHRDKEKTKEDIHETRVRDCEKVIKEFLDDNPILKKFCTWTKSSLHVRITYKDNLKSTKEFRYPDPNVKKYLDEWKKSYEN